MSFILLAPLLVALAHGGTPLLVEGEDREAAARDVSARTGLPRDQLDPLDISSLLDKPPQVIGDAVLRRCVRQPVGMEPARAELARAVVAQQSSDLVGALDHLDLAVASLGCLSELVDRTAAARIFLLRGAILSSQREIGGARSEFRTALSFDRDVSWDDSLPDSGHALLEEERDWSRRHRIIALPSELVSGPWLGGQELGAAGLEVADGLILAQYASPAGIRSAWMVVTGDASLLFPAAYREPVLERMAQPGGQREVELLLEATLPDFVAAYVHHASGGTWLVVMDAGVLETTELIPMELPGEPEPAKQRWWRRR
jgi:hypothetical protein